MHSGGKKVIDSVRVNLGLTVHDVRHTTNVLRDFGNLSSGSFLFSYQRLVDEGVVRPGDHGVLDDHGTRLDHRDGAVALVTVDDATSRLHSSDRQTFQGVGCA